MMSEVCKICGNELEKKYFKKYGIILLFSSIPMFPLLMLIAYGTIIPFLYLLFAVITGFFLIFKEKKYFYFCNTCKIKIKPSED
jgi:hypothetical protein